jgi:hypothetical protein
VGKAVEEWENALGSIDEKVKWLITDLSQVFLRTEDQRLTYSPDQRRFKSASLYSLRFQLRNAEKKSHSLPLSAAFFYLLQTSASQPLYKD